MARLAAGAARALTGAARALTGAWHLVTREVGISRRRRPVDPRTRRLATRGAFAMVVVAIALIVVPGARAATTVSSGTTTTLSLDNSSGTAGGASGSNACTALGAAPVVTEASAGSLSSGGTVTLTIPSGFAFCADAIATISPTTATPTLLAFPGGTTTVAVLSANFRTLTVTIGTASTGAAPGRVTFLSAFVKPTGTTPTSGTFSVGGTAVATGSGDTVRSVAGAASTLAFTTQPAAVSVTTEAALTTQPVVVVYDRFGNARTGDTVALAIESGPAGASLACTSGATITLGASASNANFLGCALGKSGTYRLKATVGSVTGTSSSLAIDAIAPSAVAVKARSGANTANFISGASQASVDVEVTFPAGGPKEAGMVTVTLVDGSASVTGSGSVTSSTTSVTVSGIIATSLPDGAINVRAAFAGGATSTTTTGTTATKDAVAPAASPAGTVVLRLATASDSGTYGDGRTNVAVPSFTVSNVSDGTGTGIDAVDVQVRPSGGTYAYSGSGATSATGGIYTVTAGTLADATYDVQALVVDRAGNAGTFALALVNGVASTLTIDTVAPVATVGYASYADGGTVPISVGDYASPLAVAVNGTKTVAVQVTFAEAGLAGTPTFTFQPRTGSPTSVAATETSSGSGIWREAYDVGTTTADGAATVSFAGITDAAGNSGRIATGQVATFTIDNTGPTFGVAYSRASPMGGGTLTITVTASEVLQGAPVVTTQADAASATTFTVTSVVGSSPPAWQGTYTVPASGGDGTVTVTASGTDVAGNAGTEVVSGRSFTIDTVVPTAAVVVRTSSDTGSSSSDTITTTTPAFQVTVDAGATASVASSRDGQAFTLQGGLATITGTGNAAAWVPSGIGGAALANGTYVFTFTVADGAGNAAPSATTRTITLDLVPPVGTVTTPTASAHLNDTTPDLGATATDIGGVDTLAFELKGPADADFTTAGSATMASGTVASGTWSLTSSTLAEGAWEVRAFVTDLAGNTARSASSTFTIDVTAPSAPVGLGLTTATDTGASSTDGITNAPAQAFTGTAEAYATVALYDGGVAITGATATVVPATTGAATGAFTIPVTLAAGTHAITATATDRAGNTGVATTAVTAVIDMAAPTAGTFALDGANDTGTLTSDGILGVAAPSFTVTGPTDAETGIASVAVQTSVDNGATWTTRGTDTASPYAVTASGLAENVQYRVRAVVTDVAGNVATTDLPTSNGRITLDVTVPVTGAIAIAETDGTTDDGVIAATAATFGLTGASDPYSGIASVQLEIATGAGQSTGFADTGTAVTSVPGGAASLVTSTLAAGTYTIRAILTDVAGNESTTAARDFTIDTAVPVPGTVALTDADGTANDTIVRGAAPTFTVSGASDVDTYASPAAARIARVQLEVATGGGQVAGFAASGTATTGTFTLVPATLADGTHTVRARVTDLAGNDATTPGIDATIDTTAPVPGTLAIVDTDGATGDAVVFAATPGFTLTGASDAAYVNTGAPTAAIASVQLQVAPGASGGSFAPSGVAATVAAGGAYALVADAIGSGTWRARAVVTDKAGNTATTAAITFVVDLGPPTVTVTSPAVNFHANTARPTLAAQAADAGTGVASVAFEVAPDVAAPATPTFVAACAGTVAIGNAAAGSWWCAPAAGIGADGTWLYRAIATDVAGNAATSTSIAFVVDTTAPVAPTGLALHSTTDLGVSSTDAITNVTAVTVTGTAEAGSTVKVYDTGGTALLGTQALVAPATAFSIPVTLLAGTHQVTATATDEATNVGPASSALSTTIDLTAPTVALTYSLARPVKQGDTLTITATASEALGAAPVIAVRNGDLGNGAMAGSGATWTFAQPVGSGNGMASVTLTGADVAGNALSVASGATYAVDNVAPRLATVGTSGTAYNGTTIVAFTVAFSEAVTGVTAANFLVERGLGIGGVPPVIAGVTGSGTTWTVTVTTAGAGGGGDGNSTVGIALDPANLASIVDVALNPVVTGVPTGVSSVYVMGPSPPNPPPEPTPTLAPTPTRVPTATAVPTVAPLPAVGGGGGAPGGSSGAGPTGTSGGTATNGSAAATNGSAATNGGATGDVQGPVAPLPAVGFPEAVASSRSLAVAVAAIPGGVSPEVARGVAQALASVPAEAAQAFATSLGSVPRGSAGAVVAAIGSAPGPAARTFVNTLGTLPSAETWQVTTVLGSLAPSQGAAFVSAIGSVPASEARAVVQVLAGSPPQAVVAFADFAAGQSAEESTRTVGAIAALAQAGTPVTVAAPYASTTTASGREILSFVIAVDAPPAATWRGDVEVAGAKAQGTPSRAVVVLARPGQSARVMRHEAGAWPSLALPLGHGPLAGTMPLANLPAEATALTFDPAPPGLNPVQLGSLGGGIVTPLGAPFTIDVEAPDDAIVGLSFPSIPVPPGAALGYLHETRDAAGDFLGYLRAPTAFVPATGRQDWSLAASDLRATLVLPVALRPAYVTNFAEGLRIWSGPLAGAHDFGPAGAPLTTYTVVAPQVGGRIYVLDEATGNFGWIDATGVAPGGPPE